MVPESRADTATAGGVGLPRERENPVLSPPAVPIDTDPSPLDSVLSRLARLEEAFAQMHSDTQDILDRVRRLSSVVGD